MEASYHRRKAKWHKQIKEDPSFEEHLSRREYPDRYLYVIVDGQDILRNPKLQFTYLEINDKLSRMVPMKVWESKNAQNMDLYQKVELSKPSQLLQEQALIELLDEANSRLPD